MALTDLKTDLKSLRYGKDRVGGGSSNQPYIKSLPPNAISKLDKTGGVDFLLRGGTLTPTHILNDVSRISQMFGDLKSPNGLLFTTKQNLLSLSSTNFTSGYNIPSKRPNKPDLSGFARIVNPILDFISDNVGFVGNGKSFTKNNVYTPLNTIAQVAVNPLGGHLYKQGLNPTEGPLKYMDWVKEDPNNPKSRLIKLTDGKLLTHETSLYTYIGGPGSVNGIGTTTIRRYEDTNIDQGHELLALLVQDHPDVVSIKNYNSKIQDFRKRTNPKVISPDYTKSNIEERVNLGYPGKKGKNLSSYTKGTGDGALDKITSLPLYKATLGSDTGDKNDLVSFRIGIIDNDNPNEKTYIHFRAFLDSFSDDYSSQWDSVKYMGRGENFYKYQGFDRKVSLSWTVAAQSKEELIPMYQKLNYLASSLSPDYSSIGYMRGNMATLTVGGYLYEQPGIITGLNFTVPQESPWEIALSDTGGTDQSVKELPHVIKVTGFNFIPIHEFAPSIQKPLDAARPLTTGNFGKQRYISLAQGTNSTDNNYDE